MKLSIILLFWFIYIDITEKNHQVFKVNFEIMKISYRNWPFTVIYVLLIGTSRPFVTSEISNGKVWRTPLTASSTLLKTTWKGPLSHYLTTVQGVNWSNVFSIAFKSKAQFPKYFHRALWWWKQHFFWKWRINMDFSLNELRNNWFQCHKKRCKLDLGSNSNKKLIYTLKKAT